MGGGAKTVPQAALSGGQFAQVSAETAGGESGRSAIRVEDQRQSGAGGAESGQIGPTGGSTGDERRSDVAAQRTAHAPSGTRRGQTGLAGRRDANLSACAGSAFRQTIFGSAPDARADGASAPADASVAVVVPRRIVGVNASGPQARLSGGRKFAAGSAPSGRTQAQETVGRIFDASAALRARAEGAVADPVAAFRPAESGRTGAVEGIQSVNASSAIGARLSGAVIGRLLTLRPHVAVAADAGERLDARVDARGPVQTRIRVASRHFSCKNSNFIHYCPLRHSIVKIND